MLTWKREAPSHSRPAGRNSAERGPHHRAPESSYICAIYDVGYNYLVMELLDGETLAAKLKRGKFSIEQTLLWGRQIAHALCAAHSLFSYAGDYPVSGTIRCRTLTGGRIDSCSARCHGTFTFRFLRFSANDLKTKEESMPPVGIGRCRVQRLVPP